MGRVMAVAGAVTVTLHHDSTMVSNPSDIRWTISIEEIDSLPLYCVKTRI